MLVASPNVTNQELLVSEALDGVHGHSVDFEATPFALVGKGNFREQLHRKRGREHACMRKGDQS